MSSLGAVQSDGYYHDPSWDPRKNKGKKNAVAAASRGSNQYEQKGIIRCGITELTSIFNFQFSIDSSEDCE